MTAPLVAWAAYAPCDGPCRTEEARIATDGRRVALDDLGAGEVPAAERVTSTDAAVCDVIRVWCPRITAAEERCTGEYVVSFPVDGEWTSDPEVLACVAAGELLEVER